MPTASIFENVTASTDLYTTEGSAYNFGVRFHSTVDGYITKLRWWKGHSVVDNHRPDALILWDDANRAAVAQSVPAPPSSGNDNWIDYILAQPIFCPSGKVWCISAHYPGTGVAVWGRWYHAIATLPTIPPELVLESVSTVNLAGAIAYPSTSSSTNITLLDVVFDSEYTGDPTLPSTSGDVDDALAAWLSTDANDFPARSAPYLSHLLDTDTNTRVIAARAVVDDILATIDTAMGPGGTLVTGAVRVALDALQAAITTEVDAVATTVMGPGNPTIADVMNAVSSIEPTADCGFPMTVGGSDWTQVGQTTGGGSSEWDQEADAYIFHIEELGPGARLAEGVGTEVIYWIRGWAMPWDGVNVYPDRVNFVGPDAVILSGKRWPGLLMHVPTGVEWTLTAFNYTP